MPSTTSISNPDAARAERLACLSERQPQPTSPSGRFPSRRHAAHKSRVTALLLSVTATTGIAAALALEANPLSSNASSAAAATASTTPNIQLAATTVSTGAVTSSTAGATATTNQSVTNPKQSTATTPAAASATTTPVTASAVTVSRGS